MLTNEAKFQAKGFVQIFNKATQELLVDTHNELNFENMVLGLSRGLGNKSNGPIFEMVFGNGGSTVDGTGVITYLEPNTVGSNVTLYNETFFKVVDDSSPLNTNPSLNNILVEHEDSKFFADIIVTCTLDFGEPSGQSAFDDSTTFNEVFVFDELGLRTEGSPKLLLSHVIFHPVQKSLNRTIEVVYTIRISIC